MVQIVVTPDQARVIAGSTEKIEFVDAEGNRLGFFTRPVSSEEIAIARQRAASDEPRRSTQEVLDRLQSLEQE